MSSIRPFPYYAPTISLCISSRQAGLKKQATSVNSFLGWTRWPTLLQSPPDPLLRRYHTFWAPNLFNPAKPALGTTRPVIIITRNQTRDSNTSNQQQTMNMNPSCFRFVRTPHRFPAASASLIDRYRGQAITIYNCTKYKYTYVCVYQYKYVTTSSTIDRAADILTSSPTTRRLRVCSCYPVRRTDQGFGRSHCWFFQNSDQTK